MYEEQLPSVRLLSFATGAFGGALVAVSAQVVGGRLNVELAAMWNDLFANSAMQLRSALIWWVIVVTALIGGFTAAGVTRFLLTNWWPLRLLRWILGAALVAGLGAVGHAASETPKIDSAAYIAANLSAMAAALLAASVGAF